MYFKIVLKEQAKLNETTISPIKGAFTNMNEIIGICHSIINSKFYINDVQPQTLTHWGRDKMDAIFQTISSNAFSWMKMYEICLHLVISLKFVPRVWINNIPALVQIMAWRRPGDKPLSEPMLASLLTHICVTWPQWVNDILLGSYLVNIAIILMQIFKI